MDDIVNEITELINRIAQRQRRQASSKDDGFDFGGLTFHQARIVGFIESQEASGVIARDIADITGQRPASISSLLSGLEADGWLVRLPDPSDSRRKTLGVTPKARALVKRYEADFRAKTRLDLSGLNTEERQQLKTLLTKIDQASND
ncbi:MAG TPA: hypothetical protein DCM67_05420 [Propionibacteriaceae bacterium]|nr:hypothetical protein [Propionibacteriaceae bacterium]